MWSMRLTLIVVALTVATFPAAVFDLVSVSHAVSHVYRLRLGVATIVIAALLAAPSMLFALLVVRRRRDGWLAPMLALTGFLPALVLLGSVFKEGPVAGYAVALSQGSWVLLFVSAALLVLFFPEGRLRGRDRWLAWAIAIDALLFIVVGALHPGPYPSPDERSPHVFGTLPHAVAAAIVAVTLPGVLVTLVLTVVSLVRRYRRAGVELRAQMRWLALAAMVLPLTLLAAWAGFVINISDAVVFVGLGLAYAAIPTVIGIAVLRPHLFEVDRVLASTRDARDRDGRRARDLHRREPRGRIAPTRRFRSCRSGGDVAVRATARAAASAAAAARRPLALPRTQGGARGDRRAEPANGGHAGPPGAARGGAATRARRRDSTSWLHRRRQAGPRRPRRLAARGSPNLGAGTAGRRAD